MTTTRSETGHTPGPGWELNGLRFVGPGQHGSTETFHADDFPVYAAAPDLLAAGKLAEAQINAWRETGMPDIPKIMDAQDALRAAIAKATGATP